MEAVVVTRIRAFVAVSNPSVFTTILFYSVYGVLIRSHYAFTTEGCVAANTSELSELYVMPSCITERLDAILC
jgi:hypothetical protein